MLSVDSEFGPLISNLCFLISDFCLLIFDDWPLTTDH